MYNIFTLENGLSLPGCLRTSACASAEDPRPRVKTGCVVFSQEWIHRITDNLLISSKARAESPEGRDSRSCGTRQDEGGIDGVGYLNLDERSATASAPDGRPNPG